MLDCNLCGHRLAEPLYVSPGDLSLTSLCEVRPGRTEVYFCDACGHAQTAPLPELDAYYDSQYRILLDSDEEDQLYATGAEGPVYRIDHQIRTFLKKVALPPGARVLDYGCAKGAAARRLTELRNDVSAWLFDVSDMYEPFWRRAFPPNRWAKHVLPAEWRGSFDAVMSFYVLEHVARPVETLGRMAELLRDDGVLYWLVPNLLENPADLVVADHVNHFTRSSLEAVLRRARLRVEEIDARSHDAGWIVTARREAAAAEDDASASSGSAEGRSGASASVDDDRRSLQALAAFWRRLGRRIRDFESAHGDDGPAAIYGSGFYGSFVASCLERPERVRCFVDRSPYRHGKTLLGKPIVAPDALTDDAKVVYVGLNPRSAHAAIAELNGWRDKPWRYFYLGESDA